MVFKTLNISGVLLDKNQLISHMEKIAVEHNIKINSDKNTYPIYALNENYKFILETYRILNEHVKLGIKVHSAGEWILDNFYIIEEIVKTVRKEMTIKKYCKMTGLASGKYEGFARSYVVASEIVSYTDCKLDSEVIYSCLEGYQRNKMFSIEEITNFGVFLKIAIINHVRDICEKIYSSELQRFRVEEIIERVIENKKPNERIFISKFKSFNNFDNELKYPFIEYMSYRLKKYGKNANGYQEILEEEVSKLGVTISEVVQKEHLYIANLKITIGNCIKSLRDISRINFTELLGMMNGTETILNRDPANIYSNMDQETKSYYKSIIEKLSKKTKISEVYIAEKIIELANKYKNNINNKNKLEKNQTIEAVRGKNNEKINSNFNSKKIEKNQTLDTVREKNNEKINNNLLEIKKTHVGYYLIDEGIYELKNILLNKNIKIKEMKFKTKLYISSFLSITIYIDFIISLIIYLKFKNLLLILFSSIFLFVPISEIVIRVMNYIMSKFKKPTLIPKMDFENNIPDDKKTIVVIPTILKSAEKVKEMMKKLEVYYLANLDKNLYFALLGDVSESNKKDMNYDSEVIEAGLKEVKKLNEKYKTDNFNRFHFLYRRRVWNEGEEKFIGWERKRGLLVTFNKYIKNLISNNFNINTMESQKENIPDFKYVITLDSDTSLVLGSASKLIGAMSHILNTPVIENNRVISGYGIMQPRIGLDLGLAKESKFLEIYSVPGGIDFYTNAISDIYQDYFKEGIFTGKGIYDVDIYNEILENEIPENMVLSHDLLEGNFLRCGLVTDVMLLDGFPNKYISYIKRNHRWVRGDWQIARWLKSKRLNEISKFKIFDNLRRSVLNIFSLVILIASLLVFNANKWLSILFFIISLVSITVMYILDIVNYIIFKESNIYGAVYSHQKFSKDMGGIRLIFLKIFLNIIFLPYEMWENLDSIIRSFYRMTKKKKLLEWVTAEDGDKSIKNNLLTVYKHMWINIFLGIVFILVKSNFIFKIIGILFLIAPYVVFVISKINKPEDIVNTKDRKELNEIAYKTWKFFEDNINEKNNYLICDNYQEDRKEKTVNRTSSTNIGLELISILSAFDLGFIDFDKTKWYLKNIFNVLRILSKWNGHLYNWYETDTLDPLRPRYISTVDSGNFVRIFIYCKIIFE